MTHPLTYRLDHRFPIAVVRLAGELTPLTSSVARSAVSECLIEEPTSVIVDLAEITAFDERVVPMFAGAAAEAANWPGAELLLCCPPAELPRGAEHEQLVIHPTFAAALEVASAAPVPQRVHRRLEPTVDAPRVARELAAETCLEWGMPEAAIPAEILTSELVTNAVRHARTVLDLRITRHSQQLRVSVQDRTGEPARRQTPSETDDHGRGLLIVDAVAASWGNVRVLDGKVVWASLPAYSATEPVQQV